MNTIFKIQTNFGSFYQIFLFSINFEEIETMKSVFFLEPPFAALYELNQKLLEIDLNNDWEFIDEIIKTHLNDKENEQKDYSLSNKFELIQKFLEILYMDKKLNGLN